MHCFFAANVVCQQRNDLRNATFGLVSHSAAALTVAMNAQTNKISILKSILRDVFALIEGLLRSVSKLQLINI